MVAVQIGASEELVQRPSPVSNGIAIPYPRGSDGTRRIQMRTALIAGIALSIATSPTAAKDKFACRSDLTIVDNMKIGLFLGNLLTDMTGLLESEINNKGNRYIIEFLVNGSAEYQKQSDECWRIMDTQNQRATHSQQNEVDKLIIANRRWHPPHPG